MFVILYVYKAMLHEDTIPRLGSMLHFSDAGTLVGHFPKYAFWRGARKCTWEDPHVKGYYHKYYEK